MSTRLALAAALQICIATAALVGAGDKDRLLGQAGKDKLFGGKGRDVLKRGPGKDVERQ